MKSRLFILSLIILVSLVLSACAQPEPAPAPAPTAASAAQPEPTAAPEPTQAPEPTAAPAAPPTAAPEPTVVPETAAPPAEAAKTLRLPDLKGQTVAAVTENAYTPLNFVDPATGKAVGWEYDAVNEICRRLNCAVEWKHDVVGRDDPGGEGRAVRRGDGRHHDQRRAQGSRWTSPTVHDVAAVHAGAGGRDALHGCEGRSARTRSC